MFDTPILFLIFNRADTTEKVFNEIKKLQPKYLYVAADGPRNYVENDFERCEQTRSIVKNIDWDCEIKTLFRQENLGCKIAVSSAIDWFFTQVDEGIIIEDDCLPDPSFFNFCAELLEKYRYDSRILSISGNNFQDGIIRGDAGYYFSKYPHIWGWATWKRAWNSYDVEMKSYNDFKEQNLIKNLFNNKDMQEFWIKHFDYIIESKVDTWDAQLTYTSFVNNYLNIIPNKNLVSNIGFGANALHTTSSENKFACMETHNIDKIVHPDFILENKTADDYTFNHHYNYKELKPLNRILRKICPIIKW
jgi:hypothetical protein